MYYIEQTEQSLIKYEVNLDRKKLEDFIKIIVNECGEIIHKSYQSSKLPDVSDFHIKNYNFKYLGKQANPTTANDLEVSYYQFDYDEYQDTKLVTLIRSLLAGNTSVISQLRNPVAEEKKPQVQNNLKAKLKTLSEQELDDINVEELERVKQELKDYKIYQEKNKNQKSDLEYYSEVLKCIHLKEVAKIEILELEEFQQLYEQIQAFFQATNSESFNPNISESLYKKLIISKEEK